DSYCDPDTTTPGGVPRRRRQGTTTPRRPDTNARPVNRPRRVDSLGSRCPMIEPLELRVRIRCDKCGRAWTGFADTPSQARRTVTSPGLETARRWTTRDDLDLCPGCSRSAS